MSDEKRRDTDAPIDWSSSPIDWSSSPVDGSSPPSHGSSPPSHGSSAALGVTSAPAPVVAPPPAPQVPSDDYEVEVAPEDLEDLFDDPERVERARAQAREHHASRGEPARFPHPARPTDTRSPFAALLYLAFGGYLAWIAMLSYQELGTLHARALSAAPRELSPLRRAHKRTTGMMVMHAIPAACFLLGAAFLLGRKRGTGLFLGLTGIGVTIFLVYLSVGEADRAVLRQDDVLVKLLGLAAVAWFRPRA